MIARLKEALGLTSREDTLEFMPKERRDAGIPKAKVRRKVTTDYQVTVPAETRRQENSNHPLPMEAGEIFSVDVFSPRYDSRDYSSFESYVDMTLTQSGSFTIPKEVRERLDIQAGDTIALHIYWTGEHSDEE